MVLSKSKELRVDDPKIFSDAAVVVDCVAGKVKRADIDHLVEDRRDLMAQIGRVSINHIS